MNVSSYKTKHNSKKKRNWGENFHFILRMCVCCVTQKPSMWHKLEENKVCLFILFNKFLPLFFVAYGLLSSLELPTRNIACHPSNTHSHHKYFSSLSSFFSHAATVCLLFAAIFFNNNFSFLYFVMLKSFFFSFLWIPEKKFLLFSRSTLGNDC